MHGPVSSPALWPWPEWGGGAPQPPLPGPLTSCCPPTPVEPPHRSGRPSSFAGSCWRRPPSTTVTFASMGAPAASHLCTDVGVLLPPTSSSVPASTGDPRSAELLPSTTEVCVGLLLPALACSLVVWSLTGLLHSPLPVLGLLLLAWNPSASVASCHRLALLLLVLNRLLHPPTIPSLPPVIRRRGRLCVGL